MESSHQQIERRAAQWLSRRDSGIWSQNDQIDLERWLDESPANAVAFLRLEATWARADRYKALGAGFAPDVVPTPQQLSRSPYFNEPASRGRARSVPIQESLVVPEPETKQSSATPSRSRSSLALGRFALAACLLLAVALGASWYVQPNANARTFRTPVGGTATIPLEDGSRVTLNTNSEAKVTFTDAHRRIELSRGEVFFEVAKDASRPFIVDAGTSHVVAVGTAFSVRREGEKVHVLVTEGQVRVQDSRAAPLGSVNREDAGAFLLAAGDVARAGGEGVLVQSKPLVQVLDATSWRSGFLVFRNLNLAEAIAEFNRYNERRIVIGSPALTAIRLSGKFKATNVDAFVRLLEEGYPIEARNEQSEIVLTQRVD